MREGREERGEGKVREGQKGGVRVEEGREG